MRRGFTELGPYLAPTVPEHHAFAWDEIEPDLTDEARETVRDALGIVVRWIVGPYISHHQTTARAIALAWVICPEYFGGITLNKLCRALDVSADTFRKVRYQAQAITGQKRPPAGEH